MVPVSIQTSSSHVRHVFIGLAILTVMTIFSGLPGCSSSDTMKSTLARGAASEAKKAELLGAIKSLDGEWIQVTPDGPSKIIFKVSSAGSTVREIMFPGMEHEMTNMYHMDGDALILTHYCAAGNQPRLKATQFKGDSIHFTCDSVSNLATNESMYMGEMILTIVNPNTIIETWSHFDKGVKAGTMAFELSRKN